MNSNNDEIDPEVFQEGEEDFDDDAPAFVNPEDFVEVQVDDEGAPMDEDDDDDEVADDPPKDVVDMSQHRIESHTGPVYSVESYLDPTTKCLSILSGGGDDRAFLHRISPDNPLTTFPLGHMHSDSVSSVVLNIEYVSEDLTKTPRLAAVGAYDGTIVLYDPDTGTKLQTLEGPTDIEWLSFHPKGGSVLLAGSTDGTVWMFHIPMNKCLQVFVGHENSVTAGAFSTDGKWALSTSSDTTLRVWAPRTGNCRHIFRLGDKGAGLTCLGIGGGSDGQLVIVGAEDGQAHICHIGNKKVVASVRHYDLPSNMPDGEEEEDELELPLSVEAVGFSPANVNWCATGGVDGVLKIWDLANEASCRQTCRFPVDSATGGITRLQWHPTLPLIFTSSTLGNIYLWDARNGRLIHTWTGHTDVINDLSVQFFDEGRNAMILSASDDKSMRVFEADIFALLQAAIPLE